MARDWVSARQQARAEVRDAFAASERECVSCGARTVTNARACPQCGSQYVARRAKLFGTKRARVRAAALAALALAVIVGTIALLAPGIDRAKRGYAAATTHARNSAIASLVQRAAAEQQVRKARGRIRDPGPAVPAAARLRARTRLVSELERAITADARARVRAGKLTGPVRYVTCSPYPPGSAAADAVLSDAVGSYACVAVNRVIPSAAGVVGVFGDPFWARIDFDRARFAWCKINPRPGEGGAGTGPPPVPLAQICDLEQPAPAGF